MREVKEETGLTISHPRLCGIKQWFSENTRSVCFLFATETFEGELVSSDEGENENTAEDRLSNETYGLEYFIPKQKVLRTVKGDRYWRLSSVIDSRIVPLVIRFMEFIVTTWSLRLVTIR